MINYIGSNLHNVNSLYLHFPFCKHLCNYCDFFKTLKEDGDGQVDDFNHFLESSLKQHNQLFQEYHYKWSPLKTLYIGGGTPSLWGASGPLFLKNWISRELAGLDEDVEFTLEINPGGWVSDDIKSWLEIGVNRISFGMQSYRDVFLNHLDRVHRVGEVNKTFQYLKDLEINYSVDLMLGLPFSKRDGRDIIGELEDVLKWDPPHLSVYILTTKNEYIRAKNLPSEEWIEKEYLDVAAYLTERGYLHYEVSNFAKPGFESKHNLKYWSAQSVAAIGPSASGFLFEESLRYKWKNKSVQYELEKLTREQLSLEKFYLSLRTSGGINGEDYFKGEELAFFEELKKEWESLGLLEKGEGSRLILNSKGMLQMDSLINKVMRLAFFSDFS